tara:strand:+ start:3824 stop:4015 length:192 start_codon:yes stop_codon:yes gene_type:complete
MTSEKQLKENINKLKEIFLNPVNGQFARNFAESAIEEAETLASIGRVTCGSNASSRAIASILT